MFSLQPHPFKIVARTARDVRRTCSWLRTYIRGLNAQLAGREDGGDIEEGPRPKCGVQPRPLYCALTLERLIAGNDDTRAKQQLVNITTHLQIVTCEGVLMARNRVEVQKRRFFAPRNINDVDATHPQIALRNCACAN